MKFKNIHFIKDEKVTNCFITLLNEVYPYRDLIIVYGITDNPSRVRTSENVVYYKLGSKEFRDILNDLSSYETVYIHYLDDYICKHAAPHPNIVWFLWGADFYEALLCFKGYKLFVNPDDVFKEKTYNSLIRFFPVSLIKFLLYIRDGLRYYRNKKFLSKVKAVACFESEYILIKKFFPELKIVLHPNCSYYPLELQIGNEAIGLECKGKNIWVGNSAHFNGNHVPIFRLLKSFPEDILVYAPISYGDERCIKYISSKGSEILGNRFVPIREFMNPQRYFKMYLDANAFIFGHLRQCGYGSILMALYFGGKCFLYKNNPLYQELLNDGFILFNIEDDLNERFVTTPLSETERQKNREIALSLTSFESIKKRMLAAYA